MTPTIIFGLMGLLEALANDVKSAYINADSEPCLELPDSYSRVKQIDA